MHKKTRNKPVKTTIFYRLPVVVAMISELSSGAKGLFAVLNFKAFGGKYCRVGVGSLANYLGTERLSIRRWTRELVRFGLIQVRRERGCCLYYMYPRFKVGVSIPLLGVVMKRRDVGCSYKLLLCLLSYLQAGNDWTWAMQKVLAAELGLSVRTIQRLLAEIKGNAEVQTRMRRRNRKGGNKYTITCGAVLGGRIFGADPHTTECTHLNKKVKAKSCSIALRQKSLSGDLSQRGPPDEFKAEAVFAELTGCGIHEKVARPLAFDDKQPFGNVVQAINNAKILRAVVWKRARRAGWPDPKFNVAGYVVNALNAARREAKTIGTTRLFREAGRMSRELRAKEAGLPKRKPLSEEQFERRRRKLVRQLGITA